MRVEFEITDYETIVVLARYHNLKKILMKDPVQRDLNDIGIRAFRSYINSKVLDYTMRIHRMQAAKLLQRQVRRSPEKMIKCEYCPTMLTDKTVTVDHDIPTSRGGKVKNIENIVGCCSPCNHRKGTLTGAEYKFLLEHGFYKTVDK